MLTNCHADASRLSSSETPTLTDSVQQAASPQSSFNNGASDEPRETFNRHSVIEHTGDTANTFSVS